MSGQHENLIKKIRTLQTKINQQRNSSNFETIHNNKKKISFSNIFYDVIGYLSSGVLFGMILDSIFYTKPVILIISILLSFFSLLFHLWKELNNSDASKPSKSV